MGEDPLTDGRVIDRDKDLHSPGAARTTQDAQVERMAYQLEHTLAAVFRSTYASATSAPRDGSVLLVVEPRLNTMVGRARSWRRRANESRCAYPAIGGRWVEAGADSGQSPSVQESEQTGHRDRGRQAEPGRAGGNVERDTKAGGPEKSRG